MHFEYRGISSPGSIPIPITLPQLATYILTDWVSKTPNSIANSFADFLSQLLEVNQGSNQPYWCIKSEASGFEKQWKQMTSWILGVAFAKKVIEDEGYHWWAPVSAFTSKLGPARSLMGYWNPNLPYSNCRIVMPNPKLSTLFPDYVLARFTGNKCEISFAEVKGSSRNLEKANHPPNSWNKQARNAVLLYRNRPRNAKQNLIIATRVNPKAKKPPGRLIFVRAWNSKNPTDEMEIEAFKEILKMHYFGVCQRIGMIRNARLIALESLLECDKDPIVSPFLTDKAVSEIQEQMKQESEPEYEITTLKRIPNIQMLIAREGATFSIGQNLIRIGLSKAAMGIVRYFQGQPDASLEVLIKEFQDTTNEIRKMVQSERDVFMRKDGIISELSESPKVT